MKNEGEMTMNYKFGHKVAIGISYFLHVFGASSFLVTLVALLGVRVNFWIGAVCAIPGMLIIEALDGYIVREKHKREFALWTEALEEALKEVEESDHQENGCRFNVDGQCSYSEEPMACVREEVDQ